MAGKLFPHTSARSAFALILSFLITVLMAIVLSSCGGGNKGSAGPGANVGGDYTLEASGGTLNDGSGTNGLVILVTLRDSQGWGPSLPWTIELTGPGISSSSPITIDYQDGRPGSFMLWEWSAFDPLSGSYRATATNFDGSVTIHYDFNVSGANSLARPAPYTSSSGGDITLHWPSVTGAQSYTYEVFPPGGGTSVFGCITTASANLGALASGDYLVLVRAYSANLLDLDASRSASPTLPGKSNISEYVFSFPVGGDETSNSYSLNAAGGVLDFGYSGPGDTPIYGLAIWTSLLYGTPNPNAAPAGDWNIRVTGPNGRILDYIYPAGQRHYAYWYYDVEPVIGTYTVTATYGSASKTVNFTLSNLTPALVLPTNLAASKLSNDISMTWTAVAGAKSYYLSFWADIWNNATNQNDYIEVWGGWVNTNSATILKSGSTLPADLQCDVYVTAYEVDMTSVSPPGTTPVRADMSENFNGYVMPFSTP